MEMAAPQNRCLVVYPKSLRPPEVSLLGLKLLGIWGGDYNVQPVKLP
ncbi:hypothetical protein SAMN05216474_0906 [Lishizhenia tianjinensis]|uniref:Uncharacterized protein n=1 Tax=Lishizhenia tianjinensis TaxID=477690 RepID=A0A1I6YI89_9FLAO|nr:hypothetical protein SAMN05216474_0906 [Lishizhenia tianjinensis]